MLTQKLCEIARLETGNIGDIFNFHVDPKYGEYVILKVLNMLYFSAKLRNRRFI